MSDLSIPGVSGKYNSDKTIQALVEAERAPLVRMEQDRETLKGQKTVWLRVNRQLSDLRTSARTLFGFENPFDNKIASSSDESVLTATAARTAAEEKDTIAVKRVATADRFSSRSLPRDFLAPAGVYRFSVGDREVHFNFRGGSLKELATAINQRAGDLITATVVDDTRDTQVMVIESNHTGAANQLGFHEQAAELGRQAGILERSPGASREVPITRAGIQQWTAPLSAEGVSVADGTLTVNPGAELKIPISPPAQLGQNMVLSLQVRTRIIPEETGQQKQPPSGPEVVPPGGIDYGGIQIENAPSQTVLPEWKPPEPPRRVDDMQVLFAGTGARVQPLPEIRDSEEFLTLTFEADQLPASMDFLAVRNRNTHRVVELRNVRIYDKTARGEYRPANPISQAGDAVVELNGIEVRRDSNQIDDLIPGVKLTLRSSSERPVELSVGKDLQSIKDGLLRFVGTYNQVLTQIDILTRRDESVIEDAQYLSDSQREQARKDLGLFMGNVTLGQLKSRLQRVVMDPYPTAGQRQLALLAQIGISTSGGRIGQGTVLDRTRLRGYLQIDEAKLDEALARHADWIKQLFGNDADQDLVVDSGIGFEMDRYLRGYVESGGVVQSRVGTIDSAIARKSREIDEYNRHLANYETELRRKFGMMEGALDSLEKSSQALDNFNKRMQGGQ